MWVPLLCEKSRAILLMLVGLTAGQHALLSKHLHIIHMQVVTSSMLHTCKMHVTCTELRVGTGVHTWPHMYSFSVYLLSIASIAH